MYLLHPKRIQFIQFTPKQQQPIKDVVLRTNLI